MAIGYYYNGPSDWGFDSCDFTASPQVTQWPSTVMAQTMGAIAVPEIDYFIGTDDALSGGCVEQYAAMGMGVLVDEKPAANGQAVKRGTRISIVNLTNPRWIAAMAQAGGMLNFIKGKFQANWVAGSFGDCNTIELTSAAPAALRDSRGWLICQGRCAEAHEYAEPNSDGTFTRFACRSERA